MVRGLDLRDNLPDYSSVLSCDNSHKFGFSMAVMLGKSEKVGPPVFVTTVD